MADTYLQRLRASATSILEGVQRLEDLHAEQPDDEYTGGLAAHLDEGDTQVWWLVEFIEGGRRDEI